MSGSSYNPRYSDRYYRSERSYHNHRSDRDRDSRDSRYSDHNQRRVPGLVSDPEAQLGDVERAIQRGQRETIERVQSDRYSPAKSSRATKDTMAPPAYDSNIHTVSRPYYPSTNVRRKYNKPSRRTFYNPGFLAFLPGLIGFAIFIAAIVVPSWTVSIFVPNENSVRVNYKGLFQVCSTAFSSDGVTDNGCETLEEFAASGTAISDLEQATRSMLIISAFFAFASLIVCFIFGMNRWERVRGALITGGCFLFTGCCGVAGMGCFSAVLVQSIESSSKENMSSAGTSFYLGWTGTTFLLLAALTSFMGHCAKRK